MSVSAEPGSLSSKTDVLQTSSKESSITATNFCRLFSRPRTILSRNHLMSSVDPHRCSFPLIMLCFMTGLIDAVSYSTVFVWAGFQTGNTVQLSIALARLLERPTNFQLSDQHALTSLTCFLGGSFLGRIGNHLGDTTRAWLVLGTLVQTLFTMAAALTAWQSGQASVSPSAASAAQAPWTDATTFVALGFMSASMGLQAIMGKRMNTEYATTVVLTTVYSELVAQKDLFTLRRRVTSRDHRALSIVLLFFGGFSGRAIVQTAGAPTALGVGAGIRLVITLWWLFVPGKEQGKPPGQGRSSSEADIECG